LTERRKT